MINFRFLNNLPWNIKKPRPWIGLVFVFLIFLTLALYANLRTDRIFDPDSFYHIRHARVLLENGIFNTEFPWTYYSTVRLAGSDMWYGFHILLIPFTYINNMALAIKIAGVFITFSVLVSCYFAFKNLGIKFPAFFSTFFILSSSAVLFRMAMTRPHPLSLGLLALIFSFFNSGSIWLVLIFSFLTGWLHSVVFWLPIVAVAPIVIFKKLNNQKVEITKIFVLLGGLITGMLARPNPLENFKLIRTVILDIYSLKGYELAALIGTELGIPGWVGMGKLLWPLMLIIIVSLVIIGRATYSKWPIQKEIKIVIISSFIMLLFSINMYITASRAIDLLSLFSVIFFGTVVSYYLSRAEGLGQKIYLESRIMFFCAMIPLLTFTTYSTIPRFERYFNSAMLPDRFKGPAIWLRDNTNKGDIVFHLIFDQFPSLFFWNQNNYYIYGMDPVFLYKYDQKLYWEMYYLAVNDSGSETCFSEECPPENIIPTYDAIAKDFKADYVFTRRRQHKNFLDYLESNPQYFQKVYDQELSVIFKVLPSPAPAGKNTKK